MLSGAPPQPSLRIFIIAVRDFPKSPEKDSLYDAGVDKGIADTTKALVNFLSKQYGVTPHVLTARDDTSSAALREQLDNYFTNETDYTVNLVFVMTHGIGEWNAAVSPSSSRLYLATSDTTRGNYKGHSLKATELVEYFNGLRKGSSVFLFLDTCHSGAINTPALQAELAAAWKSSTRTMIVSSSLAEQSSYNTRFTQALLSIWEGNVGKDVCTRGKTAIAKRINTEMARFPVSTGLKQEVLVMFPYTDDFCLESFASGWGLLILDNPSDKPVMVSILRASDLMPPVEDLRLEGGQVLPIRLERKQYEVHLSSIDPQFSISKKPVAVDLEAADAISYLVLPPLSSMSSVNVETHASQLVALAESVRTLGVTDTQVARADAEIVGQLQGLVSRQESRAQVASLATRAAMSRSVEATQHKQDATEALVRARTKDDAEKAKLQSAIERARASSDRAIIREIDVIETQQAVVARAHADVDAAERRVSETTVTAQREQALVPAAQDSEATARTLLTQLREKMNSLGRLRQSERAAKEALAIRRAAVRSKLGDIAPTAETERGVVMTFPQGSLPPKAKLDSFVATIQTLVAPRIEIEAYNQAGDIAASKEKVRQILDYVRLKAPALSVVARGYGRQPSLLTGSKTVPPDILQIIVSGSFEPASTAAVR
jgi:hypothetical protein